MINSIQENYKDFWAFLKKPLIQKDEIQTWQHKAKRLFSLLTIDILIMLILMPIIMGIGELGLVDLSKNKNSMLLQLPFWELVLLGVIIIPLFEELIFRLYLRFKHNFLVRLIILLASLTGKQNKNRIETYLTIFWEKKFRGIFYFSAIVFGIVHILNFDYSISLLFLAPILTAPQLFVGLVLGYLRVRHNLILGIFMHAIHNAIFLVIPILFMDEISEKLNIKTKDYSLKIAEYTIKPNENLDSYSSYKGNESIFKGISLKTMIATLNDKDEMFIESNDFLKMNTIINVNFKNHSKVHYDNKKIILKQLSKVYGFHIEKFKKRRYVWELCLLDSLILVKHQSTNFKNSGYTSTISVSSDSIIIKNGNLGSIASTLTSEYDKFIINNTNFKGNFNLKLPLKDFKTLEKILNSKYGLRLNKKEKELEYTYINFKKDK
jgi:membrane protease YdiL (CAAX protease family)